MGTSYQTDSNSQGASSVERGISEAMLRTEIGFWRDMIVSCRDTEAPDSLERMQHALALAELRLGDLFAHEAPNVFPIESARGEVK